MFFLLTLVLIILLNEANAYIRQDTETILLPVLNPIGAKEIPLTLKVFGQLIQLNLRKNDQIVPPEFEVWKNNWKSDTEKLLQLNVSDPCYYYHKDYISSAAINFCHEYGLNGLVFLQDDTLEIRPLWNEFTPLCLTDDIRKQSNLSFGKSHLIKRSLHYFADSNLYHSDYSKFKRHRVRNAEQKLIIKLAVFVDDAAYRKFLSLLDNDKEKVQNLVLAYVNRIESTFHHPSVGVSIDISLVHLYIIKKQASDLIYSDGEVYKVLDLFCKYANSLNPPDDNDPGHWDISLYLTGKNLYEHPDAWMSDKGGTKVDVRTGSSYINTVCSPQKSCAITEFGAVSDGSSSGFSSSLSALYLIGNLLGLDFDKDPFESYTNADDVNITVMSPYRYFWGYVTWSNRSRNQMEKLWERKPCLRDGTTSENIDDASAFDHSRYHNLPGREWTAKAQCVIYLRDNDANLVTLRDICQTLECEAPYKNKSYFVGPALDGTFCAFGKECRGGKCVPIIEPPYIFKYCEDDNWSEWKADSCRSSCLAQSKGVVAKRRSCKHGTDRTMNCIGPYYDVVLCDDSLLCSEKRIAIAEFTTIKCTEFSDIMSELKSEPGWQGSYYNDRSWMACTIFCQRKNLPIYFPYYAPRIEMIANGVNPYFPDGTLCHTERNQNYYCRKHHCLPENYTFGKKFPTNLYLNEDMEEL
nr:PREDICTED: A disintegrin and metalloproteinase with thrombospondin motifs 7-like [Linepithema humile]